MKRALGGATATEIPDNEEGPAGGVISSVTTSASGPPVICSAIAKNPAGSRPEFNAAAKLAVQV
jgi:hypothetical protein